MTFSERNHFTATRDGQRFLISAVDDAGQNEPITMLVNWDAPLARWAAPTIGRFARRDVRRDSVRVRRLCAAAD
jgi:hypothetical protein